MRNRIFLTRGVFALLIFLTACEELGFLPQENVPARAAPTEAGTQPPNAPTQAIDTQTEPEEQPSKPMAQNCLDTADCPEGLECIDGECQNLASLYTRSDCPSTCRIATVKLITSDGEDYEISAGQGGYTAAGALAWKIMSTPEYCSGEKPLVPIRFTTKTTGKILSEEIVTLQEGETTPIIDHPIIPNVRFTITMREVGEECE